MRDHNILNTRILFINQSAGQLFYGIVNQFVEVGYQCTLITGKTNHVQPMQGLNSKVELVNKCAYNKSSVIKRFLTWVIFSIQCIIYIKRHKNCELFIVSNPAFATFIPLFCNHSYSLLIYDIYPDVLVSTGTLSQNNLFIKLWTKKNLKIYKSAMTIYTLSDNMAHLLEQYTSRDRIRVIPNWADTSFLKPICHEDNKFCKQYHLEDKFVVLYSGNIGNTHKVECLIDVAMELKDNNRIRFVIIGDGGKKKEIKDKIMRFNLNNVLLLPYQPFDMIPYSIGSADIGVISLDDRSANVSVPSKTYSMLAVGSCLMCIASDKSELKTIVDKYDCGRIFSSDDVKGMVSYILLLNKNRILLQQKKDNARSASMNFTPANARKYVDYYKK